MSGLSPYLDHAATTPVDPRVVSLLHAVLVGAPGNAGSQHEPGQRAAGLIATAREQVAGLLGAPADTIVFTSGATEANNLAILGHVRGEPLARRQGGHVVTLATEHKAVLAPVRKLQHAGLRTTELLPDAQGLLSPAALAAALRPETVLVSLLWVNNETGVMQDIPALAAVCRERGVALHVDAVQAAGKVPLGVMGIDYLSISAHKLGGPQGVGALYVAPSRRVTLEPLIVGGGQERGLRAGTLPTHQIAAFGLACVLAGVEQAMRVPVWQALGQRLQAGLADLPGVLLNGHPTQRAPHIVNLSFEDVEGEALLAGLGGLVVSTGAACDSATGEPSYVLRALGRDTPLAQASLRFSFGRDSTPADIDVALAAVRGAVTRLRAQGLSAPLPVQDWLGQDLTLRRGEAGSRRAGAQVRLLLATDRQDRVAGARFQAFACPAVLAAAERLCGQLAGLPLAEARARVGTPEAWRQAVGAPVEKLGRLLVLEDALQAAVGAAPEALPTRPA